MGTEECVWGGPEWFNYMHRLLSFDQYRPLASLFTGTLGVCDPGLYDFLDNLLAIRDMAQ